MLKSDISVKITNELVEKMANKDWKIRKETIPIIENILEEANFSIKPKGLNSFMNILKDRIKDTNKTLQKSFIHLSIKIISSLGACFKQFSKLIIPGCIEVLNEKNCQEDAYKLIKIICDAIGPDQLTSFSCQFLNQSNSDVKHILLQFILDNINCIDKNDYKAVVQGIVSSLQDKKGEIRNKGEKLLNLIIPIVPPNILTSGYQDLKPAQKNSIRSLIEKCKLNHQKNSKNGINQDNFLNQTQIIETKVDLNTSSSKNNKVDLLEKDIKLNETQSIPISNTDINNEIHQCQNDEFLDSILNSNDNSSSQPIHRRNLAKINSQQMINASHDNENSSSKVINFKINNVKKQSISPTKRAQIKIVNNNIQILIPKLNGTKEKRIELESKNRWPIEELKENYIDKLRGQLKQVFNHSWIDKFQSGNCKRQFESLKELEEHMKIDIKPYINVIDIILKIAWLTTFDFKNNLIIKTILNLIKVMLVLLKNYNYLLIEYELFFLLSLLANRAFNLNELCKNDLHEIIILCYETSEARMFISSMCNILHSRNTQTRIECLNYLLLIFSRFDIQINQNLQNEFNILSKNLQNSD